MILPPPADPDLFCNSSPLTWTPLAVAPSPFLKMRAPFYLICTEPPVKVPLDSSAPLVVAPPVPLLPLVWIVE